MDDEDTSKVTYKIREIAYDIIKRHSSGIRYSELVNIIHRENPGFNLRTIHAQISGLRNHKDYKDKLEQTPRIYKLKINLENHEAINESGEKDKSVSEKFDEELFYGQFADFLRDDLSECTLSKTVGKNKRYKKWFTPDVFGYYKVNTTSSFNKDPELVAGELKVTTKYEKLVIASGQATPYLLYCHKSYIAVPEDSEAEALDRIEALCISFDIGLLLFNRNGPQTSEFKIRNRAIRHEPNSAFLNEIGTQLIDFLEEKGKKRGGNIVGESTSTTHLHILIKDLRNKTPEREELMGKYLNGSVFPEEISFQNVFTLINALVLSGKTNNFSLQKHIKRDRNV